MKIRKTARKAPRTNLKRTVRSRSQQITDKQARRLAARHIMNRLFGTAQVRDGRKTRWCVYNLTRKNVWLVYPNTERETAFICSSHVIIVCKRTGKILHMGLAGDEG